MGKGTFEFTLEQLAAALNKQQMQMASHTSTNTVSLPDSPALGPMTSNVIVPTEQPSKPANRCFHSDCKKKLLLSDPTCKCKERYCMSHRMPEDHACSFDYKAAGKSLLEQSNPKVIGQKFDRI
jgi:predicted nucleic acid binding AN1-type Zn finger protein